MLEGRLEFHYHAGTSAAIFFNVEDICDSEGLTFAGILGIMDAVERQQDMRDPEYSVNRVRVRLDGVKLPRFGTLRTHELTLSNGRVVEGKSWTAF